jgi:hypothetical protein
MSLRYEISAADDTSVYVVQPGSEEADDLELKPGEYSLVIGDPGSSAYAINGTRDELQSFLTRMSRSLRKIPD